MNKPLNNKTTNSSYWIYGTHSVKAALSNSRRKIHKILISKNRKYNISFPDNVKIEYGDEALFYKILRHKVNHQYIAALIMPQVFSLESIMQNKSKTDKNIFVILDQIVDPHNVGSVIRTSYAFNCLGVISPLNNAPEENSTISRVSVGANEHLPYIQVNNLVNTIKYLKQYGFWIIGLEAGTDITLMQAPSFQNIALVFGSEEKGMRSLTKQHCDIIANIPISNINSLNVSNAVAISIYTERVLKSL